MNSKAIVGVAILAFARAVVAAPAADVAAEKEIRAALAAWVEAANRGDNKAAFKVWAPDLIGWAPDGSDRTYADEVKAAQRPPRVPRATYTLTINEIIVDGSLAVVRDTWTETPATLGKGHATTFRSYEVWRRQADGRWKISRWIDGPPAPTQTAK